MTDKKTKEDKKPAEKEEKRSGTGKEKEYYDQLLRLKAEFENYRKRVEREKGEMFRWGKGDIIVKFLPLYDLLQKAHSHMKEIKDSSSVDKKDIDEIILGIEMIFREFTKVFESEGIRPMDVEGKNYDPMACEIVGVVEGGGDEDGKVVEVVERGYYYGDKILRPSKVRIAKEKRVEEAAENPEGKGEENGKG